MKSKTSAASAAKTQAPRTNGAGARTAITVKAAAHTYAPARVTLSREAGLSGSYAERSQPSAASSAPAAINAPAGLTRPSARSSVRPPTAISTARTAIAVSSPMRAAFIRPTPFGKAAANPP